MEDVLALLTAAGPSSVLAHDSDPIAIIGFFGPALVLVAIVVGLVVRDRRRRASDRADGDTGRAEGATPPRAD